MTIPQIILAILGVMILAFLFVRLRVRLEISRESRQLFVGLGRTGAEFDFAAKRLRVRVCGLCLRTVGLRPVSRPAVFRRAKKEKEVKWPSASKKKSRRRRSWRDLSAFLPRFARGSWRYLLDLAGDAIVERAEGTINAGFERPDLTGLAFGWYQAAVGCAPALAGRVAYVPDWTGASFDGSLRLSIAWPVYRMIHRTAAWLVWIRVVKIILWSIGTKEGGRDVE
jgi:hypothetical protein